MKAYINPDENESFSSCVARWQQRPSTFHKAVDMRDVALSVLPGKVVSKNNSVVFRPINADPFAGCGPEYDKLQQMCFDRDPRFKQAYEAWRVKNTTTGAQAIRQAEDALAAVDVAGGVVRAKNAGTGSYLPYFLAYETYCTHRDRSVPVSYNHEYVVQHIHTGDVTGKRPIKRFNYLSSEDTGCSAKGPVITIGPPVPANTHTRTVEAGKFIRSGFSDTEGMFKALGVMREGVGLNVGAEPDAVRKLLRGIRHSCKLLRLTKGVVAIARAKYNKRDIAFSVDVQHVESMAMVGHLSRQAKPITIFCPPRVCEMGSSSQGFLASITTALPRHALDKSEEGASNPRAFLDYIELPADGIGDVHMFRGVVRNNDVQGGRVHLEGTINPEHAWHVLVSYALATQCEGELELACTLTGIFAHPSGISHVTIPDVDSTIDCFMGSVVINLEAKSYQRAMKFDMFCCAGSVFSAVCSGLNRYVVEMEQHCQELSILRNRTSRASLYRQWGQLIGIEDELLVTIDPLHPNGRGRWLEVVSNRCLAEDMWCYPAKRSFKGGSLNTAYRNRITIRRDNSKLAEWLLNCGVIAAPGDVDDFVDEFQEGVASIVHVNTKHIEKPAPAPKNIVKSVIRCDMEAEFIKNGDWSFSAVDETRKKIKAATRELSRPWVRVQRVTVVEDEGDQPLVVPLEPLLVERPHGLGIVPAAQPDAEEGVEVTPVTEDTREEVVKSEPTPRRATTFKRGFANADVRKKIKARFAELCETAVVVPADVEEVVIEEDREHTVPEQDTALLDRFLADTVTYRGASEQQDGSEIGAEEGAMTVPEVHTPIIEPKRRTAKELLDALDGPCEPLRAAFVSAAERGLSAEEAMKMPVLTADTKQLLYAAAKSGIGYLSEAVPTDLDFTGLAYTSQCYHICGTWVSCGLSLWREGARDAMLTENCWAACDEWGRIYEKRVDDGCISDRQLPKGCVFNVLRSGETDKEETVYRARRIVVDGDVEVEGQLTAEHRGGNKTLFSNLTPGVLALPEDGAPIYLGASDIDSLKRRFSTVSKHIEKGSERRAAQRMSPQVILMMSTAEQLRAWIKATEGLVGRHVMSKEEVLVLQCYRCCRILPTPDMANWLNVQTIYNDVLLVGEEMQDPKGKALAHMRSVGIKKYTVYYWDDNDVEHRSEEVVHYPQDVVETRRGGEDRELPWRRPEARMGVQMSRAVKSNREALMRNLEQLRNRIAGGYTYRKKEVDPLSLSNYFPSGFFTDYEGKCDPSSKAMCWDIIGTCLAAREQGDEEGYQMGLSVMNPIGVYAMEHKSHQTFHKSGGALKTTAENLEMFNKYMKFGFKLEYSSKGLRPEFENRHTR